MLASVKASLQRSSPAFIFGSTLAWWYDDQDLSTIFADYVGTPATVGSAVALQLDKSARGELGSDIKSTGTPALTGTATAATYDTGTGAGTAAQVDGSNLSYIDFTGETIGRPYLGDIENTGSADLVVRDGPGGAGLAVISAGQRKSVFIPAISSSLQIYPTTNGTSIAFTVHSVKECLGSPRYQTTAAQRPILGRHPKGGRRNLFNYSEFPTGLTGTANGGTVSATTMTGPDGASATAISVQKGGATSYVYNSSYVAPLSTVHTFSVYVRMDDGLAPTFGSSTNTSSANDFVLNLGNAIASPLTYVVQDLGGGLYRVSGTIATSAVNNTSQWGVVKYSTNSARGFKVTGYHAELGSTLTAYQKVTTTYDCTEAGVPDCYYLQADGSDDGMVTPTLDLTGTDKIGVFTAVRKLSDATLGIVVEQGPTGVPNSFTMAAPRVSTTATFGFISQGSAVSNATSASSFAAPYTAVLTGLGDISGDSAILRVNGAVVVTSATDQGTGNYGNLALYYFRRGGSSLPFNGLEYGSFACAGLPSAGQIAAAEAYQNNIVGAY